jgi:cytoskeleton protein RodZ
LHSKPLLAVVDTAGGLLSTARKQKEWTIQQVADQLKLSSKQVVAIESNQFDLLPQMVIVRGFIRAYAKLLKIDANTVVALLPNEVGSDQLASASKPALSTPFLESRLSLVGRQDNNRKYLLGAALLGVLALAFFLLQKFEHADFVNKFFTVIPASNQSLAVPVLDQLSVPASVVASAVVSVPNVPLVVPASSVEVLGLQSPRVNELDKPVSAALLNAEAKQPIGTMDNVQTAGKAVVPAVVAVSDAVNDVMTLKFRQDSWVQVKKENGTVVTSHLAKAGTEESFSVKEPLQVRIGNAAGVDGLLRGHPLEILPANGSNVVNLNVK